MGEIVLRSIRGVIDALRTQDVELCDEVIAFDDEVDDRYLALEKQVEMTLARQTPVAADLRLVLAILHSALHLERMGDQCVTIAKLTKLSSHLGTQPAVVEGLVDMGERCCEMVRESPGCVLRPGFGAARALHQLDELVDNANRQVFQEVLGYVHDAEALEWGMRQITVARCFERIGDNAVDIGEQTAFLVTGEFAEFTDASHDPAAARPSASGRLPTATARSRASTPTRASRRRDIAPRSRQSTGGVGNTHEAFIRARRSAIAVGVTACLVLASVAVGASSVRNPTYNLKALSGSISADGSSTVGPYTTAAAELFSQGRRVEGPCHRRHLRHGRRLPAVLPERDRPRRRVEADEAHRGRVCKTNNVGAWRAFTVANDALTVVMNQQNNWAQCLSVPGAQEDLGAGLEGQQLEDVRSSSRTSR